MAKTKENQLPPPITSKAIPDKKENTATPPEQGQSGDGIGKSFKINTKKTKTVKCHTIKLLVSSMIKNILAWQNKTQYVETEHVHFFHSITSQGRANKYCSQIGGHTHEVVFEEKGDELAVSKIGEPVKMSPEGPVKIRISKARKNSDGEIIQPAVYDTHTHGVKYLNSDLIEINVK